MDPNAAESNELKTAEEAAAYRQQVIDEMAAEDAGTPLPESTSQPETSAAPEAPQEGATIDPDPEPETGDPWEGVNPQLKTMFDDLSQQVVDFGDTKTRLKQAEHRIGALTNELHAAKSAAAETSDAPTKEQMADAAASSEKWKELKEDYPDWAEAIEGRLATVQGGISKEAHEQAMIDLRESMAGETQRTIELAVLGFNYPDYQQTINSKDYQAWLAKQPDNIKSKVQSVKATDAISVLDLYHGATIGQQDTSQPTAAEIARQRRNRLKTSTTVQTKRKGSTPKTEADMTTEELRAKIGAEVFAED